MSTKPLIILALLFLVSCNGSSKADILLNKNECSGDSVAIDDPQRDNEFLRKRKEKILRLSGLRDLALGYDEMQIRIGYAYSSDREDLIVLTKENDKWSATIDSLKYNYDPVKDTLISIDRVSKSVIPVNGWKVLINELMESKILTLPDMSSIENYPLSYDGNWLGVEFADCKKYRYYSYQDPWGYESLHWQAKYAVQISSIIEREFGFIRLVK